MKKQGLFIIPLIMIPFIISCGNKPKDDPIDCDITYVMSGCTITDAVESVKYGKTITTEPTVTLDSRQIHPTWWTTPTFNTDTQFIFGDEGIGTVVEQNHLVLYGKSIAESFTDDSWDLFTSYLNGKTFKEISSEDSPYHDEFISKQEKQANTFVGLSRTLNLEDEKGQSILCNVLVVDENKNATANDNKFTFMITDLTLSKTFSETNNFYPDSYLNSYLNNVLLLMFPTDIKQHMQATSIDCYNSDPDVDSHIIQHSTSIYIPSASQIFGESEEDPKEYPTENNQFSYFKNGGSKTVLDGAWLRTPDQDVQAYSRYVNAGNLDEDSITKSHKLMPIFIIK